MIIQYMFLLPNECYIDSRQGKAWTTADCDEKREQRKKKQGRKREQSRWLDEVMRVSCGEGRMALVSEETQHRLLGLVALLASLLSTVNGCAHPAHHVDVPSPVLDKPWMLEELSIGRSLSRFFHQAGDQR